MCFLSALQLIHRRGAKVQRAQRGMGTKQVTRSQKSSTSNLYFVFKQFLTYLKFWILVRVEQIPFNGLQKKLFHEQE